MTVTQITDANSAGGPAGNGRRSVKVSQSMIAAAQAQVEISRRLGRPVSKVVEKIAQAS